MPSNKTIYLIMLIIAEIFFAYQFVLRVSIGVMMTDIMHKFHVNATMFGILSAFYYLGYAGMQVPIGVLMDKYGPRLVIAASAFILVLGNLAFVYTSHWSMALIGRFLIGLGSVAGFLGAIKSITMLCNEKQFSYMMSLTFVIGYIGAICGSSSVTLHTDTYGWQNVLLFFSAIGLLLGIIMLLVPAKHEKKYTYQGAVIAGVWEIIRQPQILLVCFCAALLVIPLEVFADLWCINYFVKAYDLTKQDAATVASAIYFGLCIGGPFISYMADKYQCHYRMCMLCGLVMAAIFLAVLVGIPAGLLMLISLMFVVGVCSGYQIVAFTITARLAPLHLNGVVTAVTNMIIMSSGFFFNSIIGKLLDVFWNGHKHLGVHIYNGHTYNQAMLIIPVCLTIGSIGFMWLRTRKY